MASSVGGNGRQMKLYLILVLGVCWAFGIVAIFLRGNSRDAVYQILQKGFTAFPVIAAIFVRRATKDRTSWRISMRVWKDLKLWAFCAFVPSILIVAGAVLYFVLFPGQYSGAVDIGSMAGEEYVLQITSPLRFSVVCVVFAALCVPIQFLELGEEIGWRGYLLPRQIEKYGAKKGVLLNGFCWGIAHLPLIYLGFNYSLENVGAPWSNMAMMMLACMAVGIFCSYVMVRSNNVMYSAVIHGVVNVIGEIPVLLSTSHRSGLLGPNPTGIIGMSGLMIGATVMFVFVDRWRSRLDEGSE